MKRFEFSILLLLVFILPIMADFIETFDDGDFLHNPVWTGDVQSFAINPQNELQSKATEAGFHYLSTLSDVNTSAVWQFRCRISTEPSSGNHIRFYIVSDTENPIEGSGWYVRVGGSDKNVSLYKQSSGNEKKMLDNSDRKDVLSSDNNEVEVRVEYNGSEIRLYSRISGVDNDFVLDGSKSVASLGVSSYCSLVYKTTAAATRCFFFDDIEVSGRSEAITDDTGVEDDVPSYDIDEATQLVINEVMFDPAEGGQEFVEVYNLTNEFISLEGVILSTKNDEGSMRVGNKFPDGSFIEPQGYAVLCKDADGLIEFHSIENSGVYECSWTRQLPNTGSTIFLFTSDSVMLDSMSYTPKMHNMMLEETKGVSLERINAALPSKDESSWASASKSAGYATPAAQNSQWIDIENKNTDKMVYLASESFTPNGDGVEDMCIIHYNLPDVGYVSNIRIFTPNGVLVYKSESNELLQSEGVIVWDGHTNSGRIVQVGVYIIYCQFNNQATGDKVHRELPVAVLGR